MEGQKVLNFLSQVYSILTIESREWGGRSNCGILLLLHFYWGGGEGGRGWEGVVGDTPQCPL